ncbi:AMP-binding protein [Megasphaera vaginalis (ex Srinivasan et al. 2021)]|uniref:AMP-binding enzyme n=1 Tax=Megasphaera vaginalis (ex Srinivasan et al. 2021) TaxID=1111454 RepID=U7UL96_9FIRM|nr:AMP-binding protein [Megasphaera vaginalis (ex Srinivasan et al. 2021)]ERT59634.1 AMP-binding enzyme [Megasphaera vaginalis (ex Srinivasan et al. 2021)]
MNFFDMNPEFAAHTLFVDNAGNNYTYQDWYRHAQNLKTVLRPRSLAFVICHNRPAAALSYLCCLQNGIVPLLLDAALEKNLYAQLLHRYEPHYIFRPICPTDTQPLYSLEDYGVFSYASTPLVLHPDLALLLTTSGSTGSPKLVRQSYANIQANAASIAAYLYLTEADRPVSTLPLHYTFGLSVLNSHLLVGAAEYLTEDTVFDPSFWDFCKDFHVTSLAGVPFTYECLNRLHFCNMHLPDLTLMIQAGGKLSARLHKEFASFAYKTNKRFIVMYGQTEATARMSYLPHPYSLSKIGSIGIPIPGGTFRIMEDEKTEITQPHVRGELCYEGPNVTLGYAQCRSDLALGDQRHGRLLTGDIAYKDEDGFYYIAGRKKRFLKIQGKRVNLDEIESIIKNAYPRLECACTGFDDNLCLFVAESAVSADTLEDFLVSKTGLHPATITIRKLADIPKTTTGKIAYTVLKDLL